MSDPLSIAASIAGLVAISTKIVTVLKGLYDCGVQAKQAPESIGHLINEMQDMNVIFRQVQKLILGTTKIGNLSRLRMLSVQDLVTTLSGCVLTASKLDKYLSKVGGGNDSSSMQSPANKASLVFERIKWALWKEAEVAVIIQDLQRHKSSLNLMLGIIQSHTIEEAIESLGKLHEAVDAISNQLQELVSRHNPPTSDKAEPSALNIRPENTSIPPAMTDFKITIEGDQAPDNNEDAASIRATASSSSILSLQSMRSARSVRLLLPSFMDELKSSRPYKRIQNWCTSDDSYSIFTKSSSTRGCSWSMLSRMSLGDLSISEISVIELPICLSDIWDPNPYQVQVPFDSATSRHRSRLKWKLKWPSLGGFHYAIREGNENLVRTLLTIGVDIEERDSNGRTPLAYAAYMGHESICKLLLERGASMKGIIHDAICGGNENIVQDLLALETDTIEERDLNGRTPLACAGYMGRESICKLLLARGACMEGIIHDAIRRGNENALRTLLTLETDIEERDLKGRTPLAHAAYMGHEGVYKLLLGRGARTEGIIHYAIHGGNKNIIRDLLTLGINIEERNPKGLTPLAYAAYKCREGICKLLLEKGTSEEAITSIAHLVNLTGCIQSALRHGAETIVRLLITMGADIEERHGMSRMAPLLQALCCGKTAIARLLIEKRADLFACDIGKMTVLRWATMGSWRDPTMLTEILERGAWKLINERDKAGNTPLHYSIISLTLTKILIEHGASPNIKNIIGQIPYDKALNRDTHRVAVYLWSQLPPEVQARKPPPAKWPAYSL